MAESSGHRHEPLNQTLNTLGRGDAPAHYRPRSRMRPPRYMMSTGFEQNERSQRISFKSIDQGVKAFHTSASNAGAQTRTERFVTLYAAVRPIIVLLSTIPLTPLTWRSALLDFLKSLDEVSATFKAGKDLATGSVDGTPKADMEPKLPVG
jgi:hypothetical protein